MEVKSVIITLLYHSFLLEQRKEAAFLVKVNLLSAGLVNVTNLYGLQRSHVHIQRGPIKTPHLAP